MNIDNLLSQWKEASPPSDGWTPGGRRLLRCHIHRVSLSHCVQGRVESKVAQIGSGIFYEMRGSDRLPVTITVYPAANYKEMVIDDEDAGFGRCDIETDESGAEREVHITLYVDTATFDGLGRVLAAFEQRRSLFIHLSLRKIANAQLSSEILITRYELHSVCELQSRE